MNNPIVARSPLTGAILTRELSSLGGKIKSPAKKFAARLREARKRICEECRKGNNCGSCITPTRIYQFVGALSARNHFLTLLDDYLTDYLWAYDCKKVKSAEDLERVLAILLKVYGTVFSKEEQFKEELKSDSRVKLGIDEVLKRIADERMAESIN